MPDVMPVLAVSAAARPPRVNVGEIGLNRTPDWTETLAVQPAQCIGKDLCQAVPGRAGRCRGGRSRGLRSQCQARAYDQN